MTGCRRKHLSVAVAIFDTICGEDHALFGYKLNHPCGWVGWEFCGGKIDPGETALEAARREVLEETGLIITPEFMQCYVELDTYLCLLFGAVPEGGDVDLREPHKHREWKWFPCSEPPSPLIPYAADAIRALKEVSERNKPEDEEDDWWKC